MWRKGQKSMGHQHKVIRHLSEIEDLTDQEIGALLPVTDQFEFRVSDYYSKLINWSNPEDPLRRIVLPQPHEIDSDLDIDPSREANNTPVHGLQHKYRTTALLLVNDVCAAYCRFCFRKRFTLATSSEGHIIPRDSIEAYEKETTFDIREGLNYISNHSEINNVLLTGGDPLMLSMSRLEPILKALRELPHIHIIRMGSKVPAFNPEQISIELLDMLARYSTEDRRIHVIVHFNHPRELTSVVLIKLDEMLKRGLILSNQTPLLKGVNDNSDTLVDLWNMLTNTGVTPYYLFHCRPTKGNEPFLMTIQEGLNIVEMTRQRLSGLAKRFRYVGSHATGKIEVVGQCGDQIVLRYHEAKRFEDEGRVFLWPASQPEYWFDRAVEAYESQPHEPIAR